MSKAERSEHSDDLKLLSRQISMSAVRLERLLELEAPAVIVERERRILVKRVASIPVATGEIASHVDEIERIAKE